MARGVEGVESAGTRFSDPASRSNEFFFEPSGFRGFCLQILNGGTDGIGCENWDQRGDPGEQILLLFSPVALIPRVVFVVIADGREKGGHLFVAKPTRLLLDVQGQNSFSQVAVEMCSACKPLCCQIEQRNVTLQQPRYPPKHSQVGNSKKNAEFKAAVDAINTISCF